MRCFVAIDIDEHCRNELKKLVRSLRDGIIARSGDIKWVRVDSIHITLKFLGEIDDNELVKVCEIAKEVISGNEHFDIELAEVGGFGNPPKVIWVGVKDGGVLADMAHRLEDELEKIGIKKEGKKFMPHLTLARIKNIRAARNAEDVLTEYYDYEGPVMTVEKGGVYQSELSEKGAVYTLMAGAELK